MSKVSIVLLSGSREKLQFAAMMASVAAVSAYEVTVDQWRQCVDETGEPPPVNEDLWALMLENPDWPA